LDATVSEVLITKLHVVARVDATPTGRPNAAGLRGNGRFFNRLRQRAPIEGRYRHE
jgi:hypothetical protein